MKHWFGRVGFWIFIGLLAYMPLHILLSTWLGTFFHILDVAKIAKDVVLVIGFCCVLVASIGTSWFVTLFKQKLLLLMAAYAMWTVFIAIIRPTDTDAEVLGIVYNLRFLVMFVYAVLLAQLCGVASMRRVVVKVVVVVGVSVALFGVVQYIVLPDGALAHLGYARANGVLPAFFIDNKPDFERVMSTLRDPNSLGSYLIIIGALLAAFWVRVTQRDVRIMTGGAGLLVALCLFFTFSRSAWIGAVVAAGTFAGVYVLRTTSLLSWFRVHRSITAAVVVCVALVVVGAVALKDSYVVQNVILHADKSTVLEDPNELRKRFWRESFDASLQVPLGHGVGTAGLASIRNNAQGTVLTENYYLQVLYEVGFVGLLLFLAILVATSWLLYKTYSKEGNPFALALLAAMAGLAATNFLVHIWANEAVAYTFWGLAGLYVVPKVVSGKRVTK